MKKIILVSALVCLIAATTSCNKKGTITVNTEKSPELVNEIDSLSWALGFSLAQNIASTGMNPNREVMFQAICATLDSKQQPLTREQTMALIGDLEMKAQLNQHINNQKAKEEITMREEAYFTKLTKDNPNVKKSDKGIYYEVLKEGKGMKGEIGKVVVFDYKGSFTNGQVFDQTYGNREPITHVISESIFPGLLEGLLMMTPGSKYRFYIPSEMGFGSRGTDVIPPNSIIIYEVEVHDIHD